VTSSANTREFYTYAVGTIRLIQGGTAVSTSTDIIVGATARTERVCGVYKPSMTTLLITKNPTLPGYQFQAVFSNASTTFAGVTSASFYKDMETTDVEATFFTGTSSIYEASASTDIVFDKAILAWDKEQVTASLAILNFAITTFR
jgi:hypothetical protein